MARAGDDCVRNSDCEANGRCLSEARYGWPGGYCVKDGCDVPGNECAGMGDGVVCQERGIGVPFCMQGCQFGSGWTPDDPTRVPHAAHEAPCFRYDRATFFLEPTILTRPFAARAHSVRGTWPRSAARSAPHRS